MYILDKRNTLWLRDTVRQTSLGKSAAGADLRSAWQPLTSLGMSAWPYHVTTKYSYFIQILLGPISKALHFQHVDGLFAPPKLTKCYHFIQILLGSILNFKRRNPIVFYLECPPDPLLKYAVHHGTMGRRLLLVVNVIPTAALTTPGTRVSSGIKMEMVVICPLYT